ncbi:hypothetical protein GGR55DRAFT_323261 [Xylaria sp. FL0064]|nr:hypothetical protein GGR55DRAFT_323261 [Xylaria sp. FL0064]
MEKVKVIIRGSRGPRESLAGGLNYRMLAPVFVGISAILGHVADEEATGGMTRFIIKPLMGVIKANLKNRLTDILRPHLSGYPITYNYYVEHRGWLRFRNIASRKYLGRNSKERNCVRAGKMRMWESFTLCPHPNGGCQLLATGWWDLKRAAVVGGGRTLAEVESAEEGALWDFIEV